MLKLLLVIAAIASAGFAQHCPTSIPAVQATITQVYNGASQAYQWTISPTSPVSQPPSGSTACSAPGYISQYSGGTCQANANQQTAAPQVIINSCKYSFFDGNGRTMTLALSCDASASTMQLTPTVSVTGQVGALVYAFSGKYAGICDGPTNGPTDGPNGGDGGGSPACGGGCAFTIIFFVGGGLYVIGTVAWNFFKAGKRGKELAPHPEFWLMIPGLIKDGALFSFQMVTKPCRKDGGSGGSAYTQV